MSFKKTLNQIKTLLSMEVKLEMMKLDNGTTLEADAFEAGAGVFVVTGEDRVPLPIGDYTLENGMLLIVSEEGIIGEIKEPMAEEESPAPELEQEVKAEEEPTSPKKIVESISKEMFFSEIEKLRAEIDALKLAKIEVEAEEVKETKEVELSEEVKPLKHSPEKVAKSKMVNLGKESIVEFLNKRKKS